MKHIHHKRSNFEIFHLRKRNPNGVFKNFKIVRKDYNKGSDKFLSDKSDAGL